MRSPRLAESAWLTISLFQGSVYLHFHSSPNSGISRLRRKSLPTEIGDSISLYPFLFIMINWEVLHLEEVRSAASRGYGRAWQKASKQFLQAYPLCEECTRDGRYTKATMDHVIPHCGDESFFRDRGNWCALCKSCHDREGPGGTTKRLCTSTKAM